MPKPTLTPDQEQLLRRLRRALTHGEELQPCDILVFSRSTVYSLIHKGALNLSITNKGLELLKEDVTNG